MAYTKEDLIETIRLLEETRDMFAEAIEDTRSYIYQTLGDDRARLFVYDVLRRYPEDKAFDYLADKFEKHYTDEQIDGLKDLMETAFYIRDVYREQKQDFLTIASHLTHKGDDSPSPEHTGQVYEKVVKGFLTKFDQMIGERVSDELIDFLAQHLLDSSAYYINGEEFYERRD